MSTLTVLLLCTAIFASVSHGHVIYTAEAEIESELRPFSGKIECPYQYHLGEKITCLFSLTNNAYQSNYYVLKRYTPLDDMTSAESLSVTKPGGRPMSYDGMHVKRGKPVPSEYILLRNRNTATVEIDLSSAYCINETGQYTVQLETILYYHTERNDTDRQQTLKTSMETFEVFEGKNPRIMTIGEQHRVTANAARMRRQAGGQPLDPQFVSGTAAQRELTKKIHRASYHYAVAAPDDIDDNQPHYITWFGTVNEDRVTKVKQTYQSIKNALEQDTFTYTFNDPRCEPGVFAFTSFGSRDIYLCNQYIITADILGVDTKLCTILHELGHAQVNDVIDHQYGRQNCLNLARNMPNTAVRNADNYCYFSETTNIFDYGFDSMERLPNGLTYVTRGNVYIRYSDNSGSTIDSGYPSLITTNNWGNLPDRFLAGFDSMVTLRNGKVYVTKGNEYVRYADGSATAIDSGYPVPLQGFWSNTLPAQFTQGFDAMTVLPDDKTYVTKANQYIRYSDVSALDVDPGYPLPLQGNWDRLPADFANSFDTMAVLGNGKTYVTKNKQYIRYSDNGGSTIDSGFPLPIRGNWGTINFPGPQSLMK